MPSSVSDADILAAFPDGTPPPKLTIRQLLTDLRNEGEHGGFILNPTTGAESTTETAVANVNARIDGVSAGGLDIPGLPNFAGTVAGADSFAMVDASAGTTVEVTATQLAGFFGAASLPVDDTTALVFDATDTSKRVRIDAGGVATATTATVTVTANVSLHPTAGTFAPLAHSHGVADLTATGTRDATTVLHGDNTWKVPAGGGGGDTAPTAVGATAGTHGLTDAQRAHLNVVVTAGSATDIEVPATAAAGSAWIVLVTAAVAVTVSTAGNVGSVNGTAGGVVSLAPEALSTASVIVTANPGSAPVVRVEGDTDETVTLPPYAEKSATASVSGAVTRSFRDGTVHRLTLTGNVTSLAISNLPASGPAASITFIIAQDATGGRTWAHPAGSVVVGTFSLNSTANRNTVITYTTFNAGSTWYAFPGPVQP